jgi:hypothetical protein
MGSMAMIVDAPAMRAPCTALRPSGPHPTTATADADSTGARLGDVVAPRPATVTQLQTMPSSTVSAFVNIGTIHSSVVTISSASPPMCEFSKTGVPSLISAIAIRSSAPIALRNWHMSARPLKQR